MPGTPAPAAATPVPGTASRAGEGDGGDTALREATIRAGGGEVPEPERRMPGDGVRALASPVPQAGFGKKWAWQSRGTGALPQEERCWVRRGGPGGCAGREQVSPLLAPARGVKTQPCANRSPRGGRRPPLRGQALQSPTYRHPSSKNPSGSRTPSPSSSSSWPC